jgi:hypothetical protein
MNARAVFVAGVSIFPTAGRWVTPDPTKSTSE